MPTSVKSTKVTSTKAKSTTKAKPKADAVAKKASGTKPKAKSTKAKAADAVVTKQEPKTITIKLPPGARRVENPELPDIFKDVPGVTVKASYVFDVPVSLGRPGDWSPNIGKDGGPRGSNGWVLANAHAKDGSGNWVVGDEQVVKLKAALRPLLDKVLQAHGYTASSDAKISLPERPRDSLSGLESERKAAGLPLHADKNYFPVQITMDNGNTWESAVHPRDLNGSTMASAMSPENAMRLANRVSHLTSANTVPRDVSRADVESAAATLRSGAADVADAVRGTRGSQTYWGGNLVSAMQVSGLADKMEHLALAMKQAGY